MSKKLQRLKTAIHLSKLTGLSLILVTGISSSVFAQEEEIQDLSLNGFASVSSQIRSKGISLTDEKVGYMMNLNLAHKSGAYGSVYAYNLDGAGSFGGEEIELDYLLGYKQDVLSVSTDVGVGLYTFPGTNGFTFSELYLSGSKEIQGINTTVGLMYMPERESVGNNDKIYSFIDLAKPISTLPITVKAHLGYTEGEGNIYAGPTGDYVDYGLGLDYEWKNFIFNTSYVGTNIDKSKADEFFNIPNAKKGGEIVDDTLVASITYLF